MHRRCDGVMPTCSGATSGPLADGTAPRKIHAALQQRSLLPGTRIVATGCLDAALLVDNQTHDGVELLEPPRLDDHGQARADAHYFRLGQMSQFWVPSRDGDMGLSPYNPGVLDGPRAGFSKTCATLLQVFSSSINCSTILANCTIVLLRL
jgi:hypothetical protein